MHLPIPGPRRRTRRALLGAILPAALAAAALPAGADAAVTARYSPASQTVTVFGDALPNTITMSRNAAGTILVNGGAVALTGGTSTVANTTRMQATAGGGNDIVTLNEANGALPRATLIGGADDDFLVGGSGADSLFGQSGQDTVDGRGASDFVSLSSGDDTALWSVNAGGDTVDGGADRDRLRLVGSAVDDRFSVGSNGTAVQVLHGASGAQLGVGGVEDATISAAGGADTIGVGALDDTALRTVALDLAATAGGATGDGQRDRIAIAGGDGRADTITLTGAGVAPATIGHSFGVRAGEGTLDTIGVSTQAGGDLVDASQLPAGLAALTVQGGSERDLLTGSAGKDVLDGGEGDNRVFAGAGDDRVTAAAGIDEVDGGDGRDDLDAGLGDDAVNGEAGDDTFRWKAGDGSDRLEGGSGRDELRFVGSNANENIAVSANAARVRLTRDIAAVAMDLGEVEEVRVSAAGGDDSAVVGDMTGTALALAAVDLAAVPAGTAGDARADTVRVIGTDAPNAVEIRNASGGADRHSLGRWNAGRLQAARRAGLPRPETAHPSIELGSPAAACSSAPLPASPSSSTAIKTAAGSTPASTSTSPPARPAASRSRRSRTCTSPRTRASPCHHLSRGRHHEAAVIHDFTQPLSIEDVAMPEPSDGQVLVRIEACGLATATSTPRTASG